MTDEVGVPAKTVSAWKQVVAALVLVPALGIGLWKVQSSSADDSASPGGARPAPCSGPDSAREHAAGQISAGQLCAALNRRDLPDLLGTPTEVVRAASSNGGAFTFAGGRKVANPSARIQLDTYTLTLQATYDRMPVAESAMLLGKGARRQQVLGRTAVLYSDRTISLRIQVAGGASRSQPGVPERSLVIALDAEDSGGSLELSLWREDGMVPDDDVLLAVARTVLPTIPGWAGVSDRA